MRREAGSGTIYQRADGYWCSAVELPSDGTRRRRKVIVRRDKQAVVDALRAARRDLERSGDLPTASMTLATYLDQWITRAERDRLKPRTAAGYRGVIDRYLSPTLGRIRLDKLTVTHVDRLHDRMLADGLSSTTALQAHRILAVALRDAERKGMIPRNPATLAEAPRRAVAPRPALTADQARTLLSAVQDSPLYVHWSLALLAGLRQGERIGLPVDQIDLDAGMLTVSWQMQRLPWRHGCARPCGLTPSRCPQRTVPIPPGQEAERVSGGLWRLRPKSRAGWRQVPLAPPLAATLDRHLSTMTPARDGLLLHDQDGRPIDPSRDSRAWHASLALAGLPDVPLHSARHTCSTLLFELGVDEQTRMTILGHSSAAVTRGYTHVATPMTRDAMDRLGGLLTAE